MKLGYLLATLLAVAAITARPSSAAEILRCGPSSGYAYYLSGGIVPQEDAGWQEDGISGGELRLAQDAEGFDVLYTDATDGGLQSLRSEGALILPVTSEIGLIMLTVVFENDRTTMEHYLFRWDASGRGTVVWGTVRATFQLGKSSLLVAACAVP